MKLLNAKRTVLTALAALAVAAAAQAADISGAGATFPYPIYSKWADAYKQQTGIGLNYQSIGSGGGIKQIKAKTVTFGASDMPLKPEDLAGSRPGAVPDDHRRRGAGGEHQGRRPRAQLVLDGATIASIYLGEITKWDDARIKKLNPEAGAARQPISPRSTARTARAPTSCSRTTCPSPARSSKARVGANSSVQWPVGIGAKGNEGVANMTTPDRWRDRLRRVRLRQADPDGLRRAGQQGRQDRGAERGVLPGRRRQRRLEARRRATT